MARRLRTQHPGAVHHVYARAVAGEVLFPSRAEFENFLVGLADVLDRHRWQCLGYCLLTNHYHAVVLTPSSDLDVGMKRLNATFAQGFNRRHGRKGHLFGDRYGSVGVTSTEQLEQLLRYVDLNPVAAGLVRDPVEWPWGSHAALFAVPPPAPRIPADAGLRLFGAAPDEARARYRAFVLEGIAAARGVTLS